MSLRPGREGSVTDRQPEYTDNVYVQFDDAPYAIHVSHLELIEEGISPVTRGVLSTIRIPSTELWRFTVEQLRAECRKRSLPWSGNKEDLVRRLKKG